MQPNQKTLQSKLKLSDAQQTSALASNLSIEQSPLFELVQLAPKVAIEAAMSLLRSDDPLTRKIALRLGACVVRAQGAKVSRSEASVSFMANMLRGDWSVAQDFMVHAEPAARKLAAEVSKLLSPERAMALERSYPGYIQNLSATTLASMPEVCGMMRLDGLIGIPKLFDIHCAVAVAHYSAEAFLSSRTNCQTNDQAIEAKNFIEVKEAETILANAVEFTPRVEKIYSGWSQEFWSAFWNLSTTREEGALKASKAAFALALATPINGFSTAPDIATMNANQLNRFKLLASHGLYNLSTDTLKHLGTKMATAGETATLALSCLQKHPDSHELRLVGSRGVLRCTPVNATARVLFWIAGEAHSKGENSYLARKHSSSWLALAEGLMDGGAEAPIFKIRNSSLTNWGTTAQTQTQWPAGLHSCLVPAMFLANFGHPAHHPVFDWLAAHAPEGEIAAIRSWLSTEAATQKNANVHHEHQTYQAFLDTIDIRAATPKPNAPMSSRPHL